MFTGRPAESTLDARSNVTLASWLPPLITLRKASYNALQLVRKGQRPGGPVRDRRTDFPDGNLEWASTWITKRQSCNSRVAVPSFVAYSRTPHTSGSSRPLRYFGHMVSPRSWLERTRRIGLKQASFRS